MKYNRLFWIFLLTASLLSACGSGSPQSEWKVYHAKKGSLVNPNFPAYSFEYPSAWTLDEAANHITFASEAKLLKSVPERLTAGQIIAGLSLNTDMSPDDMVSGYASGLSDVIQFGEPLSFIVNGHPASYQEGTNSKTGDQLLILAVDIGQGTQGLLTASIAAGELEIPKDTLMRMAQSLQIEK